MRGANGRAPKAGGYIQQKDVGFGGGRRCKCPSYGWDNPDISHRAKDVILLFSKMQYLWEFTLMTLFTANSWTGKSFGVTSTFLQFEEFYSQSFVPNALQVSYRVENNIGVYYNITALQSFPGKILFNAFIRKIGTNLGEKSVNIFKHKNLDFCKIMEMMHNFTKEEYKNETILQSTFINSCPFTRGFYYVENGTVRMETIPLYFNRGIYWVQVELVQLFGEVTKLMNVKAKCRYDPEESGSDLNIFSIFANAHNNNLQSLQQQLCRLGG
ncbi:uncharacterized protein LOC126761813 [Bactrocera neohumeralis]|uniref:uncharacterized protein LOC126761813 n=1 Tax=Bactrocera neohumeralis TaxID=98809 RepID=UPI002165A1A7|nr:uncharacterized protein LOC126761813 [Bactrocera neohumeralis]